jgi:hypothetical protein
MYVFLTGISKATKQVRTKDTDVQRVKIPNYPATFLKSCSAARARHSARVAVAAHITQGLQACRLQP